MQLTGEACTTIAGSSRGRPSDRASISLQPAARAPCSRRAWTTSGRAATVIGDQDRRPKGDA